MSFVTSNEVREYIRTVFGDNIEIVEAAIPLRVQPTKLDVEGASPKDPNNCVFNRTIKRMYGSQVAIFWKKVAYIDLPGTDGVRRVNRFLVSRNATQQLSDFDRGKPFKEGMAIMLDATPKHQTLKIKRKQKKVRQATEKKYEDRRKRLMTTLDRKRKIAHRLKEQINKAHLNSTKDTKNLPEIKRRKAAADAAIKATQSKINAMDKSKVKRAPMRFDLTTRNGAVGNYNFSGPVPLAIVPPEKLTGSLIP